MELFKAKLGSPVTQLAETITNTQTTISLVNADVLPDAPNIATIGTGVNAETVRYSGKTLNTLTGVTRGFTGTAKAWASGQSIARIFTQYDHDSLIESIGKDGVRLTLANNQSIPSGEETAKIWAYASYYKTPSKVLFDLSNPTRITINSDDVKKVRLTASIQWNYDNPEQGYRICQIKKNNAQFVGGHNRRDKSASGAMFQQMQTSIISASKNDYFEVMITQDAGTSQIVTHGVGGQTGTWFELEVIE